MKRDLPNTRVDLTDACGARRLSAKRWVGAIGLRTQVNDLDILS
jgi:hypothetical protein